MDKASIIESDTKEDRMKTHEETASAVQSSEDPKLDESDHPRLEPLQDTPPKSAKATGRRISVSIRSLIVATVIVALLAAVGTLSWLYIAAEAKLDENSRRSANDGHAERIALDYAADAAKIDFHDLDAWKKNLVKTTTPELKAKLDSAATSMSQILVPLQWNSTAVPLIAKVRSETNGIYLVDTFVGVMTKTMQAPDGLQSTATYSITIDSNHDWLITDVGGIGAVVGQK